MQAEKVDFPSNDYIKGIKFDGLTSYFTKEIKYEWHHD